MNNTSKIARLPRDLRIKLNRRLDNGLSTREILDWLNRDRTVRKILAEQFSSNPATTRHAGRRTCTSYLTPNRPAVGTTVGSKPEYAGFDTREMNELWPS